DPLHEHATRLLATLYGRLDRFRDRLTLLERLFLREQGRKRCETLREIARIYRETLLDLPRAEQALRLALDHLGEALDAQTRDFAEALRAELVSDLQRQGRFVDLSIYLGRALEPELEGRVPASDWHHARIDRLVELARIYRGPLDDEQ